MSLVEKIITYIRKTLPNYVYNFNDFIVKDDGISISLYYWNPAFSVIQPTQEQLDAITEQEINDNKKKKITENKIDLFDTETDILNPQEGSSVYINGYYRVYKNGKWTIQQDILDLKKKTVVDVGTGDVNITSVQLLSGIIEANPTGHRIWTLPSAADLVSDITDVFVGQTITTIFNNDSITKQITIVLGSGMTSKIKNLKLTGDNDTITLNFRIDNIDSGTESISVFKY